METSEALQGSDSASAETLRETSAVLRTLAIGYPSGSTIPRDDLLSEASALDVQGRTWHATSLRRIADLEHAFGAIRIEVLHRHADEMDEAADRQEAHASRLDAEPRVMCETADSLRTLAKGMADAGRLLPDAARALADTAESARPHVALVLRDLADIADTRTGVILLSTLTTRAHELDRRAADLQMAEHDRAVNAAQAREVGRSNAVILHKLTPPMLDALRRAVGDRIQDVSLSVARGLKARELGEIESRRGTNGTREFPRTTFLLNHHGMTLAMRLRPDCGHNYGPMDSCPGCDADEDERRARLEGLDPATLRHVADRLEAIAAQGGRTDVVTLVADLRADAAVLEG